MNVKETKIYFKGILANVDSSILQMDFNHGFKIESFSQTEAYKLLSSLEQIPINVVSDKYFHRLKCLNTSEHKMYFVSYSFASESSDYSFLDFEEYKFETDLILGYLEPIIRLMRLFKEGDIRIPVRFYYPLQDGEIKGVRRWESTRFVSSEPYHLEPSEIPILKDFIENVKLPFKRDFLNLAFENFELSYEILDMQLAFLVLMTGLETLLNPSQYEIRYRISRNTAVLLGEDRKDSEEIFAQIKKLYDKRSKIVHSGERGIIEKEDFSKLRDYLRKAIKEVYRLGKEKPEIMNLLNSYGFGEKIEKS
jgi:hypothetical protein